jgi:hypothetical protein
MSEWTKAAETQLHLHRWLMSDHGQQSTHNWLRAERESEPAKGHVYSMLAYAEPMKLLTADAIWISPEICDVIDVAREGFQPESMEREDFITPTGFAYFAKPIYMLDRSQLKVSVGAISWCPVVFKDESEQAENEHVFAEVEGAKLGVSLTERGKDPVGDKWGMSICLYSSALADDDSFTEEHRERMRRWNYPELMMLHLVPVAFGDTLNEGHLLDEEGRPTAADQWWKTVQTTLRLMQQRVVVADDVRLPRATRRRAKAEGLPLQEVMVIRLRRASTRHEGEEPSGRTLTHRHLRDGHWRGQWYPSIQKHRQIWISPTVVGDESLPLVIKKRYYKWDR